MDLQHPAYLSLNPFQAQILTAIFERIFPLDENTPGATDIGVVNYVDRALSGAYRDKVESYRLGLIAIDDAARKGQGSSFAECSSDIQDRLLRQLERGDLSTYPAASQIEFFDLLRLHALEGLFSDPIHGGNRDKLGWQVLGHPGVWLDHTLEESMSDQPADKGGRIQSIADLDLNEIYAHSPKQPISEANPTSLRFDEPVDVVLVGLGGMGGMVAPQFARAGLKTVGLEAGPWRTGSDFRPDELTFAFYLRASLATKFMNEAPRWRRTEDEPTREASFSLGRMVNGVGGSILHYGAWLRRFHPYHFRPRSHVQERWGSSVLPEDSTLVDWPLTYADLEPYFAQVERIVGVSGDDLNPFIPRSTPLPMPPLRPFRMGEAFRKATSDMGLHPFMVPVGINSVEYDGRPALRYNTWNSLWSSLDGDRWQPGFNTIPQALATGNFEVRTHTRVIRVNTDENGHVSGVDYVDANGQRRTQKARTVVLASYTFEAARLMWLSGDDKHPNGLGNSTDQLGKNFMAKMFSDVMGDFPDTIWNRHTGPAAQSLILDDFVSADFDSASHGFVGGATVSAENSGMPLQIVRTGPPPEIPRWGKQYKDFLRRWQHVAFVRIQSDALPYRGNYFDLDNFYRDRSGIGQPVVRITYDLKPNEHRQSAWFEEKSEEILQVMGAAATWRGPRFSGVCSSHDLGGCRMGEDPATSVVNADLAVHDTPGLYVFSGATFPSCPGINPTLTMLAVCSRAADRLVERLRRGEES